MRSRKRGVVAADPLTPSLAYRSDRGERFPASMFSSTTVWKRPEIPGRRYERAKAVLLVVSLRWTMKSTRSTNGSNPITLGASATKLDRALMS